MDWSESLLYTISELQELEFYVIVQSIRNSDQISFLLHPVTLKNEGHLG